MRFILFGILLCSLLSGLCACAGHPSSSREPILSAKDPVTEEVIEDCLRKVEGDEVISGASRVFNDGVFTLSTEDRKKFLEKLAILSEQVTTIEDAAKRIRVHAATKKSWQQRIKQVRHLIERGQSRANLQSRMSGT